MFKLFPGRYLLLILVCLSFFSCERILEVIKPTPPSKPVADCLIKREGYKEFRYANDKIQEITGYGHGNLPGDYPIVFTYNDKGQATSALYQTGRGATTHYYSYDEQGRIAHISVDPGQIPQVEYAYAISYKTDTITIDSKFEYIGIEWPEQTKIWSTHLYFKNGNLVRAYQPATSTNTDHFDVGFTYSGTTNKIAAQKKQFAFLLIDFVNPLMSKNLPMSRQNLLVEDPIYQTDLSYNWIIDERLYPVNNGQDNTLYFDYQCN